MVVGVAGVAGAQSALRQHDFMEILGIGAQLSMARQAAVGHGVG